MLTKLYKGRLLSTTDYQVCPQCRTRVTTRRRWAATQCRRWPRAPPTGGTRTVPTTSSCAGHSTTTDSVASTTRTTPRRSRWTRWEAYDREHTGPPSVLCTQRRNFETGVWWRSAYIVKCFINNSASCKSVYYICL